MPGPLAGVKVIDLTAVLLGPFATQHLADMGADVIKVEPPEGDLLRASGAAMSRDKTMGPIYMAANRNKRSICLDLKKPAAVEVLRGMIRTADLFIHNSRPAAMERLGLGYVDLKKINPSIVYAYSLGYALTLDGGALLASILRILPRPPILALPSVRPWPLRPSGAS